MGAAFTVTLQTAFTPLAVRTVTVALPGFTPVTTPSRTAAAALLLAQRTTPPAGLPLLRRGLASRAKVSPTPRVIFFFASAIFSGAYPTSTVQAATRPLKVVAVMTALPRPTAVTRPDLAPTAATPGSLVAKVTLPAVSSGRLAFSL